MHSPKHAVGIPLQIQTFSDAVELQRTCRKLSKLVLLFAIESDKVANRSVFRILFQIAPRIPIIVLACSNDNELARTAVCQGAKGHIPSDIGTSQWRRCALFSLAGPTCRLITYLRELGHKRCRPSRCRCRARTARELAIVRAIRHGKSNKVITHNLWMCESTFKDHVRRAMSKLKANGRAEVAIK